MALIEIEEEDIQFDEDGSNAEIEKLFGAVSANDKDGVRMCLMDLGLDYDINVYNKNGDSLAHVCVEHGDVELMDLLSTNGLDIHVLNDSCENPMHWASRKGNIPMLSYLHSKQVSMDRQNKLGESPVHIATKLGLVEVVEFLCSAGGTVSLQDKSGETALHYACYRGMHTIASLLCAANASLYSPNKEGETPLVCAAAAGSLDCVKILINAGAHVNAEDKNGWTALQHAIKRHQTTIALMLVNAGAKVNHVDMRRDTPLHIACREGLLPVVQALCAYGCRVDIYNGSGATPLHISSRNGQLEIVRCLLLAGSNPQLPSKEGVYPEIMALAQGHTNVASLLSRMKPEKRAICVEQLVPTNRPLPRIKLKVLGPSMSGKTTLVESLQSNYISGFIRKKFRSSDRSNADDVGEYFSLRQRNLPSDLNFEVQHENYTRGIAVNNVHINSVGEFSVWEFSGYEPYYVFYDHFIGDTSCIHMVVFSLLDSLELQRTKLFFWLNFIRARIPAREPLGFCGKPRSMAKVVLVGTNADRASGIKNTRGLLENKDAMMLLHDAKKEFRYKIEICDEIFAVNTLDPLSPDMKQLKWRLNDWRTEILKRLPNANGFLDVVSSKIQDWTVDCRFPVLTWHQFIDQVRSKVNPLCSEDHLKDLIQELQYTGEVVYIESDTDHDMIVLNPNWLCHEILGYLLSYDSISQARVTGSFTEDDIQFMIADQEAKDILRILIALDLCTACPVDNEIQYEFPCLNFLEMIRGLWEREIRHEKSAYGGIQITSPSRSQLVHLFPRIQTQLRRSLTSMAAGDEENEVTSQADLYQWFHGSKLTCGMVECLLTMEENDQLIEVKSRGARSSMHILFGLFQDLLNLIEQVVEDMCPSLHYHMFVLHPRDLHAHRPHVHRFHQKAVFRRMHALMASGKAEEPGVDATDLDVALDELLTFGNDSILANLKWGPRLHLSSVRTPVFQRLCYLLDPPDPMGKDWCLLAIRLGLSNSVPKFDSTNEWLRSRTSKILDEWGREKECSVGELVRVLEELGRADVAEMLIETAPMYHFSPYCITFHEGATAMGNGSVASVTGTPTKSLQHSPRIANGHSSANGDSVAAT